jgi:3-phosphoshikimate 1-carboxyvinyltransferase
VSSVNPFLIPVIEKSFDVEITLPGSKSIALRQLAITALAAGKTALSGIPECDDTQAMIDCLRQLGVQIETAGENIIAEGPMDFGSSTIHLNARMSGASARLLIALAALRSGATFIDGHASLRARSNLPLFDVLRTHGCIIESKSGCLPAKISGTMQNKQMLTIDGSISSQYITALMIIAPFTGTDSGQVIEIIGNLVSRPYIDITLNEMRKCGVKGHWKNSKTIFIEPHRYQNGTRTIEGDATAATYFSGLATLHGGTVTLTNINSETHQGDYEFCTVMEALGAKIDRQGSTKITGPRQIRRLGTTDMITMPDAALTLIAMAPLLPDKTRITGLQSLHHKECDRLDCSAIELAALGVEVATTPDSIAVAEMLPSQFKPHTLNTYHDHRMAMAFSLPGSFTHHLRVDDKEVVNKTYPNYWKDFLRLQGNT